MFKKYLTFFLVGFVINLSLGTVAFAQTKDDKEAKRERKVQILVNKLGVGERSRVVVRFKEKKKKKVLGYISQINDETFTVTNKKTNETTTLRYSEVKRIDRRAGNAFLIFGIVAGAALIGLIICSGSGYCEN